MSVPSDRRRDRGPSGRALRSSPGQGVARLAAAAWLPWAVGVATFLVGVLFAWRPGLWRDEVSTLLATQRSWSSLFAMLGQVDAVHGTYFVLMKVWCSVAGHSALALRLPSAVAMGLAAVVLVVVARRLVGAKRALVAGLVFAVLPRTTWLAVEARSYALAVLLVVLAIWLWLRAVEAAESADSTRRRRVVAWVLFALTTAAAVAVFLHSVLVFAVLVVALIAQRARARTWVGFVVAVVAAAAVTSPLTWVFLRQRDMISWILPLTWSDVVSAPAAVSFAASSAPAAVGWALGLAGAAVLLRDLVRRRRLTRGGGSELLDLPAARGLGDGARVVLLLGWLVVPTLVLILASAAGLRLYVSRYASPSAAALAILIACGLWAVRPRLVAAVLALTMLVTIAPQYYDQRTITAKSQTRPVASFMKKHARPGDGVLYVQYSPIVGTSRVVPYAYPGAFRGTKDLTLETPVERTRGLWETQVPLARVPERLEGVRRIWVIGPTVHLPREEENLDYLREHGWRKKGWVVLNDTAIDLWVRKAPPAPAPSVPPAR